METRKIVLNERVEDIRDKKEIITIEKFSLKQIKNHFNENIINIKNHFLISDELQSMNKLNDAKDIWRSQIVFLQSSFDFYLHEISKYSIIKIFNNEWNKTDKYSNFKVEMRYVEEALKKPESNEWFLEYVNDRFKRDTYLAYDCMKDQINLMGLAFEEIKKDFEVSNDDTLKNAISSLYLRRNEIAHQSDRNHFNSQKNDITKEYVLKNIEYIEKIVDIIHNKELLK